MSYALQNRIDKLERRIEALELRLQESEAIEKPVLIESVESRKPGRPRVKPDGPRETASSD